MISVIFLVLIFTTDYYSQESDLSIGIEYAPLNRHQLIKASLSLTNVIKFKNKGISVRLDGKFRNSMYSVGFGTTFSNPSPTFGINLEF